MFVQVIRGKVSDPSDVRGALESWGRDLAPDATGWLGSTVGVTDDGTMIAVARFDTEDSARRSAERPEHGRWWDELKQIVEGDVTVDDSTDVDDYVVGDPGTAGFVQVMQGRVTDLERATTLMRHRPDNFREIRPDILGLLGIAHTDGRWTSVAYFTSEAEARRHESQEPPPDFVAMMDELRSISVGEPTYNDLRQVWFLSPESVRTGSMAGSS